MVFIDVGRDRIDRHYRRTRKTLAIAAADRYCIARGALAFVQCAGEVRLGKALDGLASKPCGRLSLVAIAEPAANQDAVIAVAEPYFEIAVVHQLQPAIDLAIV